MPFSELIPVLTPRGRGDNALPSYARSYSQPAEVLSFVGKSVVVGTQCIPQYTPFARGTGLLEIFAGGCCAAAGIRVL